EKSSNSRIDVDVALVVTPEIVNLARKVTSYKAKIVLAEYTLLKKDFDKIKKMSSSGYLNLIHQDPKVAPIRKKLLVKLGIPDYKIHIVKPENTTMDNIVAFGYHNPPSIHSKNVVTIPGRLLSIFTIIEIAFAI